MVVCYQNKKHDHNQFFISNQVINRSKVMIGFTAQSKGVTSLQWTVLGPVADWWLCSG